MNNSGMYTYVTENNDVIICGPPSSPDPDYTYHNTVTVCGQPGSPDSEDDGSPEESDTDKESSFESSDSSGSKLLSTPVKQSAPNYMLEPYVATPTTSDKRIRRRHLHFSDPNLMYDLEDISEDESASGEPLAQKPMTDDDVMDNESMRAWINALASIYKSRNE